LTAAAKRDLEAALGSENSGTAILNFVDKYRNHLAKILTKTQLAAVLEGAREVAAKIPTLTEFPGAIPPPPTLEPTEALALVEKLEKLTPAEQAKILIKLPIDEQTYLQQAIAARAAQPAPTLA